jgi:hypothetical protein
VTGNKDLDEFRLRVKEDFSVNWIFWYFACSGFVAQIDMPPTTSNGGAMMLPHECSLKSGPGWSPVLASTPCSF